MRAILMFRLLWGTMSQDSVHKPQTVCRERRAEAESSRGPFEYQPNAIPLGQTGSHTNTNNTKGHIPPTEWTLQLIHHRLRGEIELIYHRLNGRWRLYTLDWVVRSERRNHIVVLGRVQTSASWQILREKSLSVIIIHKLCIRSKLTLSTLRSSQSLQTDFHHLVVMTLQRHYMKACDGNHGAWQR